MNMRDWVVQLRYPYAAGVVVVMWLGTALFIYIAPELSVEAVTLAAAATLIVVALGLTSKS